MAKKHTRLGLDERMAMQDRLDEGSSIRDIAKPIGRAPSTVSKEIEANRSPFGTRTYYAKCFMRDRCAERGACGAD